MEKTSPAQADISETDREWVSLARSAYESSTDYVDSNYRKHWEDDLRHFQGEHHSASKFNSPHYKYRSKMFRPKTRAMVRAGEAACAGVFFSTEDVVNIEPANPGEVMQRIGAEVMLALLNYRLQKTVPWFLTCVGAFQDAQIYGVCCSKQYWRVEYQDEEVPVPVMNEDGTQALDEEGLPAYEVQMLPVISKDEPVVDLIPVEQIRIHPASDWRNPVKSSPYLVYMMPMHVGEVKERMKKDLPGTGRPTWRSLEDQQIQSAIRHTGDTTTLTREDREDKYEHGTEVKELSDFDTVWVHENFVTKDGIDYVYYTMGTEYLLSWEILPVKEVYHHGERPFVMGMSTLETHKIYPRGGVGISSALQREINEVVNQRLDNVSFVLNKRYLVNRGSQVDLSTLLRNVAGSITLVNDVDKDVREINYTDITASAYGEHDRMYAEFDELTGAFSTSSVMTNRKMNETVGGMAMMRSGATAVVEYSLKLFAETWVEPVIRQIAKLEAAYETDVVLLSLASRKLHAFQRYGINPMMDEVLNQDLTISVNVGYGATDPVMKVNQFVNGLQIVMQVITQAPQGTLNYVEIAKEVFGRLGYRSSERFFMHLDEGDYDDPEKQQMVLLIRQLQEQIGEMGQMLDDKQGDRLVKMETTRAKEEGADRRMAVKVQGRMAEKYMDLYNPVAGEQPGAAASKFYDRKRPGK